jgi:hypothetical protein
VLWIVALPVSTRTLTLISVTGRSAGGYAVPTRRTSVPTFSSTRSLGYRMLAPGASDVPTSAMRIGDESDGTRMAPSAPTQYVIFATTTRTSLP